MSDELVRASGAADQAQWVRRRFQQSRRWNRMRGPRRGRRAMPGRSDRQQLRPSRAVPRLHRRGGLSAHRDLPLREPTLLPRYGRSHGNAGAGGRRVCGDLLHRPDGCVGGQQRGRSPRSRRVDPPVHALGERALRPSTRRSGNLGCHTSPASRPRGARSFWGRASAVRVRRRVLRRRRGERRSRPAPDRGAPCGRRSRARRSGSAAR